MTKERTEGKKIRRTLLYTLLAVVCLSMVVLLSSCSKEEISLTINDGSSQTDATAYVGEKVQAVLEDAEITLGDNDVVTPEADYKLTADDTEILIERYAAVTVADGDETYEVELTGATVQDALDEAGIELGENDTVNQDLDAYLTDGMVINVERSYNIKLVLDKESSKITTGAATVADLIEEQGIDLGDKYDIDPSEDTALKDGMKITIKRTITEEVVEEEEIKYDTTYENSSNLDKGKNSVKQEGVNGKKEVTYKVTYVNGEETNREKVSEDVIEEPVDEIILKGTKSTTTTSSSSSSSSSSSGSSSGKTIVEEGDEDDCDGSGHGTHYIIYSDGSSEEYRY